MCTADQKIHRPFFTIRATAMQAGDGTYRESDDTHGSVDIAFKCTPIQGGTQRVVLENGSWKVNEK